MTGEARRRRSPGWAATLLGGGLLVLLGFAFGMVVGASVEDPDLIASVMAGQATEVELPPEETIADRLRAELRAEEPAPRPLGSPRETTPPVAAAPPRVERQAAATSSAGGGFSVQVGAFGEEAPAQGLRSKLQAGGFKAFIAHSEDGSGERWRVRVGPVPDREQADQLARRLKRDQGLPTWVVTEE